MVLEDHIRRGRKLIPPLMALDSPIQQTTWHVERLPELLWLALIIKRLGSETAFDLGFQLTQAVQSTVSRLRKDQTVIRAYIMSEHLGLSTTERQGIVDEHADSEWLGVLRPHVADLVAIWPDLPLRYLTSDDSEADASKLVDEVRDLVEQCSHRHDKLALCAQATAVATEIRSGHLMIAEGLPIPDLNAVFDYPDSDESQHAAGFVVTTCNAMIMHRHRSTDPPDFTWQRSFWNRCYKLQPCEYD